MPLHRGRVVRSTHLCVKIGPLVTLLPLPYGWQHSVATHMWWQYMALSLIRVAMWPNSITYWVARWPNDMGCNVAKWNHSYEWQWCYSVSHLMGEGGSITNQSWLAMNFNHGTLYLTHYFNLTTTLYLPYLMLAPGVGQGGPSLLHTHQLPHLLQRGITWNEVKVRQLSFLCMAWKRKE